VRWKEKGVVRDVAGEVGRGQIRKLLRYFKHGSK
jgi:hypothetical protein